MGIMMLEFFSIHFQRHKQKATSYVCNTDTDPVVYVTAFYFCRNQKHLKRKPWNLKTKLKNESLKI